MSHRPDGGARLSGSATTPPRRLPVNQVKIDRSSVTADDDVILAAIVRMASALGLRTVAEGIEEERHAEPVRRLGCTYGQGWRYGHPQDAEASEIRLLAEVRTLSRPRAGPAAS